MRINGQPEETGHRFEDIVIVYIRAFNTHDSLHMIVEKDSLFCLIS